MLEEHHAIGEIDKVIYTKFSGKFKVEISEFEKEIQNPEISSSNLQKAIDKALIMSSRLHETSTSGDLEQKRQLQNLVFRSGIGYDKQNDRVKTKRVNSIFSAIPLLTKDLDKIKSGEPVDFNQFSARVTLTRFKLVTAGAEIQCAIQLRHRAIFRISKYNIYKIKKEIEISNVNRIKLQFL